MHNVWSAGAKKRPASSDDGEGTPVKRGRPKGSSLLMRYPQLPEASNDAASNERNNTALKKEIEKEKPRKDVVLSLMKETFSARREEILFAGNLSLADILLPHKGLKFPYAVSVITRKILQPQFHN